MPYLARAQPGLVKMIGRGLLASGPTLSTSGAASAAATTWSASDKAGTITLSLVNLRATCSAASTGQVTRAVGAKSSGQWYWEIAWSSGFLAGFENVGVANSSASLTDQLGSTTDSWSLKQNGQSRNGSTGSYGAGYDNNDTVGVAVDLTAGKIWFSVNGVWQGTGNPETAANPAWSNITGNVMPAVCGSDSNIWTANFGGSAFTYTVPTGFTGGWTT
jgi:hypothetical protein